MHTDNLSVSLVSHGHGKLVLQALQSLASSIGNGGAQAHVWLTLNLPEPDLQAAVHAQAWPFSLTVIHNAQPLGFGANHNQAFAKASESGLVQWFVVMNPDIFWPKQAGQFWEGLATHWPHDVGWVWPAHR